MRSPLVIVPACTAQHGAHPDYAVQMKYVDAILQGAACLPLILPALGERIDWDALLSAVDGVMLTGSPSNVHPSHFGQTVRNPALPLDPARDETNLPLVRAALERGLPLFAICRGMQEVNVALGGSLHQAVQENPGFNDHREGRGLSLEEQYGPAHAVTLIEGGLMAQVLGGVTRISVNSLHGQGIDRLAPGLRVEAVAEDGLVEAYSVESAPGFALAVQWHPEWRLTDNPVSMKLYAAFGAACRQYQLQKKGGAHADL
ncbi:gamma-glutamyl-gamma-aminobutyrate hydrolase family protein [Herminiimonas sp. CN]|uniref:gamma-glutamyl-gamma-aminobutyrate hydrolase family protein n=1 Tax=Herminiimonas sp. CN TaxID=1349818 RepID=UPI0004738175|nr:gamma-glutamyl-gamma-aminobutyrate hydrolase family protein [Herminiimonas sp. CN]